MNGGTASLTNRVWRGPLVFLAVFGLLNAVVAIESKRLQAEHAAELLQDARFENPSEVPRRDRSIGEELDRYWRYIPDAQHQRLAILVGMSQMYAINDRKPNDRTISELVDDELRPKGARVFGLAAPNLDGEEALFYLVATTSYPETHPYAMLYGVCFDKFRNTDIRPGLQRFLQRRPGLSRRWKEIAVHYAARYPHASEKMLSSLHDIEESRNKTEDHSMESALRDHVVGWLPVVKARKDVNALTIQALSKLRNKVLNIKASTKRPIIGARYELNQEFLQLLADEANAKQVRLLPYVIPLNPRAENPYVASEYAGFKVWFSGFARERGLPFVNLESLVPTEDWGFEHGEPDFKHFRGAGHRRTATALGEVFGAELLDGLESPAPP